MLTFGSLFAGIGGFDLGFERAGMRCEWQVELNPYCRRVLKRRFPLTWKWDDVRTFPPDPSDEWPLNSEVDVIVGGDPCQGNSNAGSVWKKQHPDLGREFVRVVDVLRPRIVVRENPYPSRPDAPWTWWRMRSELERLGYAVLPFRLRSCCLGAHHRRDRVFLLGELADAHRLADAVQGRGPATGTPREVRGEVREQRVRADAGAVVCGAVGADTDGIRLEGIDGQGEPPRHSRGECRGGVRGERLDGVPTPRVCRSRNEVPNLVDRVTALGNSIDPIVAEWIGRRIVEAI